MDNWFEPDRNVTRTANNPQSDRTDLSDPYSFHQQPRSAPNWDAYDYNQGPARVVPRPPQPGFPSPAQPRPDVPVPLPSRTDAGQPRPDAPIPLPPLPDSTTPREVRLPDGARNVTDEQGRVILTASADGSKTREVRYGDAADPAKVTQVTIDHNRVYTRNADGRSWNCEVNGQPAGTWYGDVQMSPKGEYSFQDDRTGERRSFAPNTTELGRTNQNPDCPDGNCNNRPDTRNCPDGNCDTYYPVRPIRGGCYDQGSYDGGCNNPRNYYYDRSHNQGSYYGGCSQGYRPYCGGAGQFGTQVLAGLAGYGLQRLGGYHHGYYPGYNPGYYPGYYGGGNLAGAIVGQVIGRAIFGHHRR